MSYATPEAPLRLPRSQRPRLATFRFVTLPLLGPVLLVTLLFRVRDRLLAWQKGMLKW